MKDDDLERLANQIAAEIKRTIFCWIVLLALGIVVGKILLFLVICIKEGSFR